MLTLSFSLIALISIVLTFTSKKLAINRPRLGKTMMTVHPFLVIALLALVVFLGLPVITTSPALVLYLLLPVLGWFGYTFHQWHKRHPGAISKALIGIIRAIAGRRSHSRSRANRSRKQKEAEELPPPRSYIGTLLPSWVSLMLHTDKPLWSVIHQGTILLGALAALNMPASMPIYIYYLLPPLFATPTLARWVYVNRTRQKHINSFYGLSLIHI